MCNCKIYSTQCNRQYLYIKVLSSCKGAYNHVHKENGHVMSDTIYGRVRGVCRIFRLPKYTEIAQNLLKLLLQKGNASFHDLFIVLK